MLSAFKNFGVTFLIAVLLFGVLAYFATGFVTSTMSSIMTEEEDELSEIMQNTDNQTPVDAETESEGTLNPTNEKIPEGESFNFLIITTDYRPDLHEDYKPTLDHMYQTDWYSVSASDTRGCLSGEYREIRASSIVLVRADKESRQYTYTYFSPETQVYTPTGYHTLAEVYGFYGTQTVADHINAMTGVKIKYTFLINAYNFDEVAALCGTPTISLSKNIYQDADLNYTTQVETTVEHIGDDGYPWTEHIPNTLVLSAGDVTLEAAALDILNSFREESAADVAAKEAWSVEIAKAYLNSLVSLEYSQLKILLTQLITNESEWTNIEGSLYTAPETVPAEGEAAAVGTEAPAEEEPYNPWEDTGGGSGDTAGTGIGTNAEPEETVDKIWLSDTFEPDGPIVETSYTINDFDSIYEVLCAVAYFENITVSYPGEFVAATDDTEAYLNPDLQKGLTNFLQYRK